MMARIPLTTFVLTTLSIPIIRMVSGLNIAPKTRFFTNSLPCAFGTPGISCNPATSFCPMIPFSCNVFQRLLIAFGLLKNASSEPLPSISATIAPTYSGDNVLDFATACSVLFCAFFSLRLNLAKVSVVYGIRSSVTSTKRGCSIPLFSIRSRVKPKFSALSKSSLIYSPSVPSLAAF